MHVSSLFFFSSRRRHTRSVSAFLLNRSSDLNIYNNYFKAPWMPDRTEANPNELNQDDARYGFRCCHLKNIWTAPLPPETELSRKMTTSTTSIDIMGRSEERRVGAECRSRCSPYDHNIDRMVMRRVYS